MELRVDPKDFNNQDAGKTILTQNGFWVFIPNPLPPKFEWTVSLIAINSEAERELSHLSALVSNFPFPQLLIPSFIRSEAVISSRIEGTKASLADLYTYEISQPSFFESSDDVREVYNYVEAMEYGVERLKSLPVSLRLIRELHEKLLTGVRGGALSPGEFRRTQNWIGSYGSTPSTATYVPPPVDEMNDALGELEKFIHSQSDIPPLVRTSLIHYQFEAIHPFLDGNGRVGRLLIALLLCEWGLLPNPMLNLSEYLERYRQQYYDLLLNVSQQGAWEEWIKFILCGIRDQSRKSVSRLDRMQTIRISYQTIIDTNRNPKRMTKVVDFLFSRPILSVKQLSDELDLPVKTAGDYINQLVTKGLLKEITGNSRNRIYRADEIFNVSQ
jgi:Fic family protein